MSVWNSVTEFIEFSKYATDDEVEKSNRSALSFIAAEGKARGMHDADGFHADFAWSSACIAAGHKKDPAFVDSDGFYLDYEDELAMDGEHVGGFDGDMICVATRNGIVCTYCEGDCYANNGLTTSIWDAKGVSAEWSRR